MKLTEEQEALFKADPLIKVILEVEKTSTINFIGGAVIDILEGRKVKDYDLTYITDSDLKTLGFEYCYETKTAKTYKKGDIILQKLKTASEDFDFKISQTALSVTHTKNFDLQICENSFNKKILIPCDKAWTEPKNALNSLRRIPHYKNKGYTIDDITYLSLLSVVGRNNNKNS